MNIAFSRILKIEGRNRECNFRKLPGTALLFHVDVSDGKGGRVTFQLCKGDSHEWQSRGVVLPSWLLGAEPLLGQAIEEHLSQGH